MSWAVSGGRGWWVFGLRDGQWGGAGIGGVETGCGLGSWGSGYWCWCWLWMVGSDGDVRAGGLRSAVVVGVGGASCMRSMGQDKIGS